MIGGTLAEAEHALAGNERPLFRDRDRISCHAAKEGKKTTLPAFSSLRPLRLGAQAN
jgi:hypothetical protein